MISKNVKAEEHNGINIVRVTGSADFNVSTALEFHLDVLMKKHPAFTIIDLSNCTYMGSVTIGILTNYVTNARINGRIFMVVQKGTVREMLSNFRILPLFELADSVEVAIENCSE